MRILAVVLSFGACLLVLTPAEARPRMRIGNKVAAPARPATVPPRDAAALSASTRPGTPRSGLAVVPVARTPAQPAAGPASEPLRPPLPVAASSAAGATAAVGAKPAGRPCDGAKLFGAGFGFCAVN